MARPLQRNIAMNGLQASAGFLALLGGFAHMVLGEMWIISPLDPKRLPTTNAGSGDTIKRYLRWFWHVGTVMIFLFAGGALLIGLSSVVPSERLVANILSIWFAGGCLAFCVVAVPSPRHFVRIPQGLLMGLCALLLWFGSS